MRVTTVVRMMALQQLYRTPIITPFLKIQTRSVSAARIISSPQMANIDYSENNINYNELVLRRAKSFKNLYTQKTFSHCCYCHGTGYVKCYYCTKGCWKCCLSTMLECRFCNGDGDARLAYQNITNEN